MKTSVTVDTVGALAALITSQFVDGAKAWVIATRESFELVKNSAAAADDVTIVAPLAGAPAAGNPDARWVVCPCGSPA